MLPAVRLIELSPLGIGSWTKREGAQLREHEKRRARRTWYDRLHELFAAPVFQRELDEPVAPLSWAPLTARHQGLRRAKRGGVGRLVVRRRTRPARCAIGAPGAGTRFGVAARRRRAAPVAVA